MDRIKEAIERAKRTAKPMAVCWIDQGEDRVQRVFPLTYVDSTEFIAFDGEIELVVNADGEIEL